MTFEGTIQWVEKHPTESIIIGGAGIIALLWLLGAFGGGSSNNSGASSLASAYYAAEAQQAVVGGQIQMANINAVASTAQMGLQTDAAVKINAAQTGAAVTINGQNADAATAIGGQQLLATYSNNNAYVQANASNNAAQVQISQNNANASLISSWLGSVIAPETMGGTVNPSGDIALLGGGTYHVQGASQSGTPGWYAAAGYSPSQIASIFGGGVAYPGTVH